jgi:ketosteroid isomerase-like protein
LEIVKAGYAAFGRGDVPGILEVMDSGVEWTIPAMDGVSWSGTFKGHDGLQKFFTTLAQETEFEIFEPRSFTSEGDTVSVQGYEKVRSKRTGKTYESDWVQVFKLSGGKVTHFREYTDTAKVTAAHS